MNAQTTTPARTLDADKVAAVLARAYRDSIEAASAAPYGTEAYAVVVARQGEIRALISRIGVYAAVQYELEQIMPKPMAFAAPSTSDAVEAQLEPAGESPKN